jgi:glycogen synthase
VPELIVEGKTGFSFEAANVSALRDTLLAALRQFADTDATARECLRNISRFDPRAAASNIARGCVTMLAGANDDEPASSGAERLRQ